MLSFPTQTALDWGSVNVNSFSCTAWVDLNYLSLGADQSSRPRERRREKGREGKKRGREGREKEKGGRGKEVWMRREESWMN